MLNTYHRDQFNSDYLMKHIPNDGVEERLQNLEVQLSLEKPIPRNVYKRLKLLEDRLLYLESVSPEYIHFWVERRIYFGKNCLCRSGFLGKKWDAPSAC